MKSCFGSIRIVFCFWLLCNQANKIPRFAFSGGRSLVDVYRPSTRKFTNARFFSFQNLTKSMIFIKLCNKIIQSLKNYWVCLKTSI
jgi:hypothetical protein